MGNFGDTAKPLAVAETGGWQRRARAKIPRSLAWLAAFEFACALTGCANDPGQLLIDPGRYTVYKCDDLAKRWKAVSGREKELHDLMAKADESGAGVVIGAVTYRADYEAVLSDERLLQRTAAEKNCALPIQAGAIPQTGQPQASQPLAGPAPNGQPKGTPYQSDQGIR